MHLVQFSGIPCIYWDISSLLSSWLVSIFQKCTGKFEAGNMYSIAALMKYAERREVVLITYSALVNLYNRILSATKWKNVEI